MLDALNAMARRMSCHSVAVTFHPHPTTLLRPDHAPPLLTTIADRTALLHQAGIDQVVVLPVTAELLQMSAEDFFSGHVIEKWNARGLVEGTNFRFGRDRLGGADLLRQLCHTAGIELQLTELLSQDAAEISSSRIRQLLSQGYVKAACELLGHGYTLRGIVQRGAGRGTGLVFPTANLHHIRTLLPAFGVYAAETVVDGQRFVTAVNIGPNPTFGEQHVKVECYLDQYAGSLYDRELAVELIGEIRGLQSFTDATELVKQITSDVENCRRLLALETAAAWRRLSL